MVVNTKNQDTHLSSNDGGWLSFTELRLFFRRPRLFYAIVSCVVLLFVLSNLWNQRLQGDFWRHSAVVRELSLNPLSPGHPHVPVDAPHEFYSPYALVLGLFCRVTGLSSIASLCLAAVLNTCLFVYCIRLFCLKLAGREWTAFYVLLFTLVLWGYRPWMFSQFYHLAVIGDTAAYPCCFAAALTFLVWSIYIDIATTNVQRSFALLWLLMVLVLLSHPHTGIVMYIGLLSLWLGLRTRLLDGHTVLLALTVSATVIAAFSWPYYRFAELLSLAADLHHHAGNRWMYVRPFQKIFAALVGLPLLAARFKTNKRDPISIMFVLLLIIYCYGYASGKYGFGRVIVYVVFCLHFGLADWCGKVTSKVLSCTPLRRWEMIPALCITGLVVTFALSFLAIAVYRYRPGRECSYTSYLFLREHVTRDDVILTDRVTSRIVPSLAGKVTAAGWSQTFVKDDEERREDVRRFMDAATKEGDRRKILSKYDVDFILLDRRRMQHQCPIGEIEKFGRVVFSNEEFLLINVRDQTNTQPQPRNDIHGQTGECGLGLIM